MKKLSILLLWLSVCSVTAWPQQTVSFIPGQSTITVQGTSSLHDWEEKAGKFDVAMVLKMKDKEITGIDKVNFTCKSASITGESSIMNNKTKEALQSEKYPDITFKLVSVDKISSQGGIFSGTASGDLSLAGVTKRVTIAFTGSNANNHITLKGSKSLSMNEYKIKPPTAMLGTLKTGDQVTITFNFLFQIG
jgi:polyisoprenoid-binding protein YceI